MRGHATTPQDSPRGQLSLPGLDLDLPPFKPDNIITPDGRLLGYTLFLAIFPEPEDAERIAQAAVGLCNDLGLVGQRSCNATRFALVVSHVGRTHHQWLAEWRLTGRR